MNGKALDSPSYFVEKHRNGWEQRSAGVDESEITKD